MKSQALIINELNNEINKLSSELTQVNSSKRIWEDFPLTPKFILTKIRKKEMRLVEDLSSVELLKAELLGTHLSLYEED